MYEIQKETFYLMLSSELLLRIAYALAVIRFAWKHHFDLCAETRLETAHESEVQRVAMPLHNGATQESAPNDDEKVVAELLHSLLDRIEEGLVEGTSDEVTPNNEAEVASTSDANLSERINETKDLDGKVGPNAPSPPSEETDRDNFKLKSIRFDSIKFSIVTQNLNGPCPLIALVNVLVLKGLARLPSSGNVSRDALTQLIADTLLRMRPENMNSQVESNYNRNLDDVINILPDLGRGLDVNIRFRHVNDFEFTPALSLFDLLRINLYHGWLPDPQFAEIRDAIGELTYNQIVERICDDSDPNRFLYEEFLGENISQLTYHGLVALMEAMRDGELAVLFRNNHFHTIHKRRDLLYLLVSDSGYVRESDIVWESFNTVDGSSLFFNGDFEISTLPSSNVCDPKAACSTEADFLLAQELQACEDELARQEAEREKMKFKESPPPPTPRAPSSPSSEASSYERAPYRNGRTAVTNSGSKEKKCTIS
ncbi:unnamed protein product [Cylicocyclus nassatus]|uniref:Ubiquitin carboxyl-terminal hydrolase n=1 Tax=Cylicocyclus nassatus TaxID=53992 RepID=A0AA36H253_CYLNA|nr:unnamed protein product [Cylicocyclus nassatus]